MEIFPRHLVLKTRDVIVVYIDVEQDKCIDKEKKVQNKISIKGESAGRRCRRGGWV